MTPKFSSKAGKILFLCFLQKKVTTETKYVGTNNTPSCCHFIKKQAETKSNSIQDNGRGNETLLTWEGGFLSELVSYWLASDDMMLHIHVLPTF